MTRYLLQKIVNLIITLVVVTFILQIIFEFLPGDPLVSKLGVDYQDNPAGVEYYTKLFNLDKSFIQKYFIWIKDIFNGSWGTSYYYDLDVSSLIFGTRMITTLSLAVCSFTTIVIVSIVYSLQMYKSYISEKRYFYRFSNIINQIFISLPTFWVGIILMTIFGLILNLVPISNGTVDLTRPLLTVQSLILPVISISLGSIAYVSRYLVSTLNDEYNKDYVTVAKAKGLTDYQIIKSHMLRNSLIPVITLFSMIAMGVITGSVVIENLFSLSGVGSLLVDAITNQDYPLVQGIVFYYVIVIVVITFVTDLLYTMVDPRIKVHS